MNKQEIIEAFAKGTTVYGVPRRIGGRVEGKIATVDTTDDTVKIAGMWCDFDQCSTDPNAIVAPKPYARDPRIQTISDAFAEWVKTNCPRIRLTGSDFTDAAKAGDAYLFGAQPRRDESRPGRLWAALVDEHGAHVFGIDESDESESFDFID